VTPYGLVDGLFSTFASFRATENSNAYIRTVATT